MVEYHGWSAQPGERVLASLPGLEPQGATLVWIEDNRAGIAFEVPLAAATLDPARSYVVGARILLGDQVLYASAVGVPVVTQGAPTTDVVVNIPPQ